MKWRIVSGGLSVACALLFTAGGCGGGGSQQATALKPSSGTKSEPEQNPADSGTPAVVNKSVGSKGDQPSDADAVKIPLDQIWALHMPGTKNILELDPDGDYNSLTLLPPDEIVQRWNGSLLRQITEALSTDTAGSDWPKEGQSAKPGFAVIGTGVDALREAIDVMVKHKPVRDSFPKGLPVSLVFFSYAVGAHFDIQSVDRVGNSAEIQYRLVVPRERLFYVDFALIPIGALPPDDYRVRVVRLPSERELPDRKRVPTNGNDWTKKHDKELSERFVCKSFNFSIVAEGQ
jgi:hypothetical protein